MPSRAKNAFEGNKADIDTLWKIHEDWASIGSGPGRRPGELEVINRSAIVFVTACWEAYVEDVVEEAFEFLIGKALSADAVPEKLRGYVAKKLMESKDPRESWKLAGDGWRAQLQSHKQEFIVEHVESFHTPKSSQADTLFKQLLGIPKLSDKWGRTGMTSARAREKLDKYVEIRGSIAHRVKYDEKVHKSWGTEYLNHVVRLVESTDDVVKSHLLAATGLSPW